MNITWTKNEGIRSSVDVLVSPRANFLSVSDVGSRLGKYVTDRHKRIGDVSDGAYVQPSYFLHTPNTT